MYTTHTKGTPFCKCNKRGGTPRGVFGVLGVRSGVNKIVYF